MDVKVRQGDSLWYYSQLFYMPLPLLLDSNRDMDVYSLQIGQSIKIPGFYVERYSIQKSDSLWSIANNRNMNVDALLLLNQDTSPSNLQVGQDILVPVRVTSPIERGQQAFTFSKLENTLNRLLEIYPFLKANTIGKSVDGLPIYEIVIGKGKKQVHFDGSFHANEWITTSLLLAFLNNYALSLTNGNPIRGISMLPIYQSVTLSIVPMVNPDGVNLVLDGPPAERKQQLIEMNKGSSDFSRWKANIRGVDLNNQYPAKWEVEKERKEEKSPAYRDYPGDAPLTEPEAIAMAELAKDRGFDRLLAFHTQGQEFYWGYEGLEPEESVQLAKMFERVSGYRSIRYVDSYAGYKDWFIKEFQKAGFTIEAGLGINPLPLSQFQNIYERVVGIILVALYR
ncbi:M14 family metallopeptidase [Bacillus coahuilensis]|uniref:M14 family metallopeptidase n=1 Tax=Bacillus coahuilensis TaxID=408580 RepID=UPI0001850734|nr:M14 family metallopeptidase [Bacillus coahuilensis]